MKSRSCARVAFYKVLHRTASTRARDQRGVTSIEYALIGALIAVVIVASVSGVGTAVGGLFDYVASNVPAAVQ